MNFKKWKGDVKLCEGCGGVGEEVGRRRGGREVYVEELPIHQSV